MIRLIRFVKGYVRIKIWGFAPERFFNLCSNKNILLWDIQKKDMYYEMYISLSGFRSLQLITRKTKTRVVILERHGLPFLMPGIFLRKIFIAGLVMTCLFLYLSTKFVWEISLTGNLSITEDAFYSFLSEEGIKVGSMKKDIDIESLEKHARIKFPEITWISAKFSGTVLSVSVKESDTAQYPPKKEGCADIYAEKDGLIISMMVRAGVPKVSVGENIETGMLLVSGEVPVYNDDETVRKYQETYADADIVIRRTETIYVTLPFTHIQKVYTGRENKKNILILFGKEFTFGKEGGFLNYDTVEEIQTVSFVKGFNLPISFGNRIYREYQNTEKAYTLNEAKSILSEKYAEILHHLQEQNINITEKQVKMDSETGKWILKGELTVEEKIGVQIER